MPQTVALSALMFTGGSQFAFVGVLSGGGSFGAATVAASLLGLRNGVYAVQLAEMLRPRRWLRPLMAQLTIDESMATSSAQDDAAEQRRGFWTAGLGVWVCWNLFTVIGALAGQSVGDPKRFGLDGAAVAAFLGLLWPRLKGRDPVVVGVVCALMTALVTPAGSGRYPDRGGSRRRPRRGLVPASEHLVTPWHWILLASAVAFLTKLAGLPGARLAPRLPGDAARQRRRGRRAALRARRCQHVRVLGVPSFWTPALRPSSRRRSRSGCGRRS